MTTSVLISRGRNFAGLLSVGILAFFSQSALAEGTLAGTDIANTASVSFDIDGTTLTQDSNTVVLTVAEILDVSVLLQSPQIAVSAGETGRELLFTVTNTGNGSESFRLDFDNDFSADPAVDFNPTAQTPAIYFDTDGSGDFSAGDVAYSPGTNDPTLDADESINMLIVNDIPTPLNNGDIGRSALSAVANTGSGVPGTSFAGQGTGGVDAVVGSTGADQSATGEYVVAEVTVVINKSAVVTDQFGGSNAIPGATIAYTITVEVTDSGTATAVVFTDPIPANTSYVANSIQLNGAGLSDETNADAGELDSTGAPTVVVRLGDLTQASGVQTVQFSVTID